jgi:predicted DsbA family dithiol-disulfide isomerase
VHRLQRVGAFDRLRGLRAVDRIDRLGSVGAVDRIGGIVALAPVVRLAAVGHVRTGATGCTSFRSVDRWLSPTLSVWCLSVGSGGLPDDTGWQQPRNSRRPADVEPPMLVEIWSDVVCPWCYIGKRRFESALEQFEHKDEVEVRWRSYELDPNAPFRRPGRMAEHLSRKYGMSVEQAEARLESMNRLAAAEGLRYDLGRTQGGNTFDAHRLIHLGYERSADTGARVKEALLKAYFEDLEPVSEPEVLQRIGESAGLEADEVRSMLDTDRFASDVRADEADAAELGCTGVPFFVFDRAFAVPGAQDPDTFLATMRRAWSRSHPPEALHGVDAGVCTDDSCAI